ncbi:hypothetical protein [Micromonospora maritima]|uniref:hypothetical protein n=1 Tax=Micromonospora maritima TaxID=986711 RepID=UPI00157D9BD7|nr:hypothetical protein [Micromonospora maritima]
MPRTITKEWTVYTFEELTEEAQAKAVEKLRERRASYFDEHDRETIGQDIVYTLAEKFRSPGWDTFGAGDFPGIDRVQIDGWSIDYPLYVEASGALDRENAPALPWVDEIERVDLEAGRHYTRISVVEADPECTCTSDPYAPHDEGCPTLTAPRLSEDAEGAMEQAVRDALHDAAKAGEAEWEYMTGEERARDEAVDMELEFEEDGTPF